MYQTLDDNTRIVRGEQNQITTVHGLPKSFGKVVAPLVGPRMRGQIGANGHELVNKGDRPTGIVGGDEVRNVRQVLQRLRPKPVAGHGSASSARAA